MQAEAHPSTHPAELPQQMTLIILLLGMLAALGPLSIDMYLPAFDSIAREFAVSNAGVQISLAVYFAGFSIGQLVYGPLSDRYGRKPPLYVGLLLYTAATAGCFTAGSIHALILFRGLQALGGCAGVVISRAVVRDNFNQNHAARVFSLLMLVMGVAPIIAPLAGGYVTELWGWRHIFAIQAGFALLCLGLLYRYLPESRPATLAGSLSVASALRSYREVMRDRCFWGYALSGSFGMAAMFAYIAGSPYVLIDIYGVAPRHYGWFFGSNAVALIGSAQINSRLLSWHSYDHLLRRAYIFSVAFGLYLVMAAAWQFSLWLFAPGLVFFAATLGFISPNFSAGALVKQGERAGAASALMGTLQFSLAALAAFAVSYLFDETARPMALVMAACSALAWLFYYALVPFKHRH